MKRMLLLMLGALWAANGAIQLNAEETTKAAMRAKLDYARGALEGLTLAKFDLVTTNALQLKAINYTNTFVLVQHPDYAARSTNFLRSVDRLLEAAKAGNLERATAAYGELTRACIACHQTFRREQSLKVQGEAAQPPR